MSFETVAVGPILSATVDLPAGEVVEVATTDVVGAAVISTVMEDMERAHLDVLDVAVTPMAQRSVAVWIAEMALVDAVAAD